MSFSHQPHTCIRLYSYNMARVKLGCKKFDVDSEWIDASFCGVSDADCAAFAERMKTGEISRVKTLNLVRFIVFIAVREGPGPT